MKSVVLLRGVNVGGRNKLPMKAFKAVLEELGCENVRTYIQSGNAVVDGAPCKEEIKAALAAQAGVRPHVFVMAAKDLEKAARICPFRAAGEVDGKSVHLYLMQDAPDTRALESLGAMRQPGEDFAAVGEYFYLHTPHGLAKSKIAEKIDRVLKTTTTARNWNTVKALLGMVEDAS